MENGRLAKIGNGSMGFQVHHQPQDEMQQKLRNSTRVELERLLSRPQQLPICSEGSRTIRLPLKESRIGSEQGGLENRRELDDSPTGSINLISFADDSDPGTGLPTRRRSIQSDNTGTTEDGDKLRNTILELKRVFSRRPTAEFPPNRFRTEFVPRKPNASPVHCSPSTGGIGLRNGYMLRRLIDNNGTGSRCEPIASFGVQTISQISDSTSENPSLNHLDLNTSSAITSLSSISICEDPTPSSVFNFQDSASSSVSNSHDPTPPSVSNSHYPAPTSVSNSQNPAPSFVFNFQEPALSSVSNSQDAPDDDSPIGDFGGGETLKVSEKVVWISGRNRAESGVVMWIGDVGGVPTAGVSFENQVGNTDGKFKGIRYFECGTQHGGFLPLTALIKYSDYYCASANIGGNCKSSIDNSGRKTDECISSELSGHADSGVSESNNWTLSDEDDNVIICAICQDPLLMTINLTEFVHSSPRDVGMVSTFCGHLFHAICLNKWFHMKPTLSTQECPYCKKMMDITGTIRIFPVLGKP